MAEDPDSEPKKIYVVVNPPGEQTKVSFYRDRSAAEKAAKAAGFVPGTVHVISI